MAAIPLHPTLSQQSASSLVLPNPLPQLLHTPSGLALLELQGTIHLPDPGTRSASSENGSIHETAIGRLIFPDYQPDKQEVDNKAWMNRVYLYVGKHQRLTGQVKKLPKPLAVIRKRGGEDDTNAMDMGNWTEESRAEELEIVEIVKWKILFSQRPEPVGTWTGET